MILLVLAQNGLVYAKYKQTAKTLKNTLRETIISASQFCQFAPF
jgi:hypothetical protein